jgi:predicted membrane channel-forming protein YqfA (hemolysin III family)
LESEIRRPAEQKRWQDPIWTEESWVWWYMPVKAAIAGWRILIQATLGKRQDPVSKITRVKRVWCMTQVVKHLLSKCKTLCSRLILHPPTTKK